MAEQPSEEVTDPEVLAAAAANVLAFASTGLEGLTLVHPTDATKNITLNGSKWGLESIDLGNPARRDELVGSLDASGATPFRMAPRENREVTIRIRLLDATNTEAAMDSIGALEAVLESAERFASSDPIDPVLDNVRLVYQPTASTYQYSLIVYAASITELPRTLEGEDAGWFIKRPVLTIQAICDPFAYGAGIAATRTSWLSTTVSGTGPDSKTVPSAGKITGDVAPFVRARIGDASSQTRGRVIIGTKENESITDPSIVAGSLTLVNATRSGSGSGAQIIASSTDWSVACQIPRQTRTGPFRIFLTGATSDSTGSVRLVSAPANSSRRTGGTVSVGAGTAIDADLGEVAADSSWDGWIQTKGSVKFNWVILIPADSYVDVTGASPGEQMVGPLSVASAFVPTTNLNGQALTSGTNSGSWSNVQGTSTYAFTSNSIEGERQSVSDTTPALIRAGTTNYLNVNVDVKINGYYGGIIGSPAATQSYPFCGVFLRRNSTNGTSFVAGLALEAGLGNASFGIWKYSGTSTFERLYKGPVRSGLIGWGLTGAPFFSLRVQTIDDGRWYAGLGDSFDAPFETASGYDQNLASGGNIGSSTNAGLGLFHYATASVTTAALWQTFRVSALAGVTPQPIPANTTLTLNGPKLLTSTNSEYPYIGSSGLALRPGVNNNVTTLVRPASNTAGQSANLTIDGWPRFLSVPHG